MVEVRSPDPRTSEPNINAVAKPDKKKWVHGEVRRQQIFDEAIDIIGQRGYRGFTLQELAQRCGLSNAGLLHHFPSKDQLLIGLLNERDRRDYAALESAGLNFRETTEFPIPFDDLYKALREVVARDAKRPEIVRLYTVLRAESLDEDHPARDFFLARAARALDELTRMLESNVPDPRSTARQLIALHGGLEEQWLREGRSFDLVEAWERAARLLLGRPAS
ncbi:MAG: TetR/AcrR family transcriptional regulator [Sphingomonadales bacterium]|nr:MAG: TetR/AcrR family transcriptional regulator [Sphingomonadales bacterium]